MQEIIQKRPIVIAKFYLGGFKGRNQIPGDQVSENEQLIGHRQMWQFKHATIWTWKVWATLWDRLTITSTPKSYVNTRYKHISTWAVPTPHCESPFEYHKATNNKLSNRIVGIPRSLYKMHPRCSSGLEPHFHIS